MWGGGGKELNVEEYLMIDSLKDTEIDLGWRRDHEKVLVYSGEYKMSKKIAGIRNQNSRKKSVFLQNNDRR
jgi:hypothetical protein